MKAMETAMDNVVHKHISHKWNGWFYAIQLSISNKIYVFLWNRMRARERNGSEDGMREWGACARGGDSEMLSFSIFCLRIHDNKITQASLNADTHRHTHAPQIVRCIHQLDFTSILSVFLYASFFIFGISLCLFFHTLQYIWHKHTSHTVLL